MSKDFDLSSFEKPIEEKTEKNNDVIPTWVSEGTNATRVLYSTLLKEIILIEKKIDSNAKLTLNERRIVKSRIAEKANVDPSILTERRQPDLINFILEQDILLDDLWKNKNRRNKHSVKKLKRKDLEKEVSKLKKHNKDLSESFCRDSIEEALKNVFLKSQIQLSKENTDLRKLLEESNDTISNLRSALRKYQLKAIK